MSATRRLLCVYDVRPEMDPCTTAERKRCSHPHCPSKTRRTPAKKRKAPRS